MCVTGEKPGLHTGQVTGSVHRSQHRGQTAQQRTELCLTAPSVMLGQTAITLLLHNTGAECTPPSRHTHKNTHMPCHLSEHIIQPSQARCWRVCITRANSRGAGRLLVCTCTSETSPKRPQRAFLLHRINEQNNSKGVGTSHLQQTPTQAGWHFGFKVM